MLRMCDLRAKHVVGDPGRAHSSTSLPQHGQVPSSDLRGSSYAPSMYVDYKAIISLLCDFGHLQGFSTMRGSGLVARGLAEPGEVTSASMTYEGNSEAEAAVSKLEVLYLMMHIYAERSFGQL